ncbi:TPA: DNA polymerase IV [Candidatus Acetothermia bacterium]|nr:DNA polymerase IV [Candidatus Acetothermia bacterium]
MERWVLHVDMDAFYASVEQLDNPSLKGRPVIVGGLGPRGVVATASYQARAYGVHSAMPMARARRLCPHGVFLPPRFARYQELSSRIQAILREYTPLVEPISLDEAFLDLTGTQRARGSPEQVAREIHTRIPREVGLPCSVGLGPSKLLAKLASDSAKPGGLRVIKPEDVIAFMSPLPVERLWGIGPKTAQRLTQQGIRTVQDLRGVDVALLSSWFGPKVGTHLWRLARGLDDSPVIPVREAKSFSQEVTYPEDLYDQEVIRAEVRRLAHMVAGRLKEEGFLARVVRIKVRWEDFVTNTRQLRLPEATDNVVLLSEAAVELLSRLETGRGVRLVGVGVAGLVPASFRPLHLFLDERLSEAAWRLRARFGEAALMWGWGPSPPGKGSAPGRPPQAPGG